MDAIAPPIIFRKRGPTAKRFYIVTTREKVENGNGKPEHAYLGIVSKLANQCKWKAADRKMRLVTMSAATRHAAGMSLFNRHFDEQAKAKYPPPVDYDAALCRHFVADMITYCSTLELKNLWVSITESLYDDKPTPRWHSGANLLYYQNKYFKLSLWNRQQVLFLLAPYIERLARQAALDLSRRARKEEPL